MTRVYAERDGNGHILCARGHADGSEAACAFISGIIFSLAGYLENADDHVDTLSYRTEPGDAAFECIGDECVSAAFEMAVIGLLQLEKSFPQYVKVDAENF